MQKMIPAQQWWKVAIFGFVFSFVLIAMTSQVFAEVPAEAPETENDTTCINPAIPPGGITLEIPLGVTNGNRALDLPDYLSKFYQFVIASIAILAAAKIIIAGFNWIFAAGSQEKIGKAKEELSGAIWGLMIALLSYSILNIVNPKLVEIPPICPPLPQFVTSDANYGKECLSQSNCGYGGLHCAVTSYWEVVDGVWDFTGNGTEQAGTCVDGRTNDFCVGVNGKAYEEWCQSGSCVAFKCQDHQEGWGQPCAAIGGPSLACPEGLYCFIPSDSIVGTCSDGTAGSPCAEIGRSADEYCKSGLTCKDNKCNK